MAPIKFYTNSFEVGDEYSMFGPWSFVHLASGIIAGAVAATYLRDNAATIESLSALWLALVIVWEGFELAMVAQQGGQSGVYGALLSYEHPINRLCDIAVGLLGFSFLILVGRVDVVAI